MHAAAHEAEQREVLCTCNAFHRPHPHHGHGPAPDGAEPAGDATHEHDREPLAPAYLRGVLTVEAELSDGSTGPDGWMLTSSSSPVLVALSYVDGTASLVTEDPDGHLTRLRIPGEALLRLTHGAERKLAASRAQSEELRQRHKPAR
jgi:hypothetical protein